MFGFLRKRPPTADNPAAATAVKGADQATDAAAALPTPGSISPSAATEPAPRAGWMQRLKAGLKKTSSGLGEVFGFAQVDEATFEDLETRLLMADVGVDATERILDELRGTVKEQGLRDGAQVKAALLTIMQRILAPLERGLLIDREAPLVIMITGVNGAGKTTSIGKLTHHLQAEGKSILLAAGDTFRAAAREQLTTWGERNGVQVISQQGGDPAAVAFDAVSAGVARKTDVVLIDTAGRLHTQKHLMDELQKIKRVLGKALPGAPHETLLVLDGNTGQNMLAQVKAFDEAVNLTGLIITKLDGTAKAGAILGLAHMRRNAPIPVVFIGIGEGIDDLQGFSAMEFTQALVG